MEPPVIAPSGEQIEITVGDQRATIVEIGGGLRSYSAGGRDLIDGYGADEMSIHIHFLGCGCVPLTPQQEQGVSVGIAD
jgi:hypothetical protein